MLFSNPIVQLLYSESWPVVGSVNANHLSGANRKGNLVSRQLHEIGKELSNNSNLWLIVREFHTGRVSEGYRSSTGFSIRLYDYFSRKRLTLARFISIQASRL
jgi:hypothetical protein